MTCQDPEEAVTEPGDVYIDALLAGLARAGDQPVLTHRGQDTTAASFRASVYRCARALADLGIGRESLVALFAPTSPDALAVRATCRSSAAPATSPWPTRPWSRRLLSRTPCAAWPASATP